MKTSIISENDFEHSSIKTTPSHSSTHPRREKINNLEQKEIALEKSGVTRQKYMRVIAEALIAVKTSEVRDSQGNVRMIETPDVSRRQWGAEQAAALYGDKIARQEVIGDIEVNREMQEMFSEWRQARRVMMNRGVGYSPN